MPKKCAKCLKFKTARFRCTAGCGTDHIWSENKRTHQTHAHQWCSWYSTTSLLER